MREEYGVVLFDSIHHALRAEKITKKSGFKVRLIPVPRELSSDCGSALRFRWEDGVSIKEMYGEKRVSYVRFCKI